MKDRILEGVNPREDDLSRQLCLQAANNIYSDPERVAKSFQQEYLTDMTTYCETFSEWANEDNVDEMIDDLRALKDGYLKKRRDHLAAMSRCASAFITGPANFPVRQMEKRNNTERRRADEWIEWVNKRLSKLENKYNPTAYSSVVISSDDEDALEKLQERIEKLEAYQATMKAINKIARKKGKSIEEKTALLIEQGFPKDLIVSAMTPNYLGGIGFESYALTNNNAKIKRLKGRLETLTRQRADTTKTEHIEDVEIVDNVEENRVQLRFPERPTKEFHSQIRRAGFVYSRTNQAYQRKRTGYALQKARELAQAYSR